MSKQLKKGDTVIYKKKTWVIDDVYDCNYSFNTEYFIVDPSGGAEGMYITQLDLKMSNTTTEGGCNCGAKWTSFPDHHYDWCSK